MKFFKNEILINENAPEMGKGIVLEESDFDQNVKVYFIDINKEKILSRKYSNLKKVEIDEGEQLFNNFDYNSEYQSLESSVVTFQNKMPGGFYGEMFLDRERDYKQKTHLLSQKILSKDALTELLRHNNHKEISKRVLTIVNKTNLIHKNEKMDLSGGLKKHENNVQFPEALFNLLYGEDEIKNRFENFVFVLEEIEALKWPIASYFLFIHFPDEHMFIKPENTQSAAKICGWNIHYNTRPNWNTYRHVLELANYVREKISDLKPRDLIDIQSFFWVINPNYK